MNDREAIGIHRSTSLLGHKIVHHAEEGGREEDQDPRCEQVAKAGAEAAQKSIEAIVKEPEVGQVYTGTVKRIMDFGAFVEFLPGKEGLVHISELEEGRTEKTEDVVQPGDVVQVKLLAVDERGRLKLSRRAAMSAN